MREFSTPPHWIEGKPPPPDSEVPTVSTDDWHSCEEAGRLWIPDISHGLAIVGYNRLSRKGVAGHFKSVLGSEDRGKTSRDGFRRVLEAAFELSRSPEATELWLSGGAPFGSEEEDDLITREREAAESLAASIIHQRVGVFEPDQLTVAWLGRRRVADIALDCRLGSVAVINRYETLP
ncbi:MAG TPA: hypothetical protein VIJ68_00980 [Candidatus Saccharimonadales bacterium]